MSLLSRVPRPSSSLRLLRRRPLSYSPALSLRAFPPPTSERPRYRPPIESDDFSPFASVKSKAGKEMGGSEEEVVNQWGGEEVDEARKREWWGDPYVRMLQEPRVTCMVSGKELPAALTIKLRPGIYQPTPEDRETFVLVPEEILHPEYASFVRQPNEHGMPNLQGPSVGCSDGLLKLFDTLFAKETRLYGVDLPISEPLRTPIPLGASDLPSDNRPAPDLETRRTLGGPAAAAISRRERLVEQVRSQLVTRVSQEVELLAEKLVGETEVGGERRVLRRVSEDERDAMRDQDWDPTEHDGSLREVDRVVAILELDTPSRDISAFLHGAPKPSASSSTPPPTSTMTHPHPHDFRPAFLREALKNLKARPSSKKANKIAAITKKLSGDFYNPPEHTTCPLLVDLSRPSPSSTPSPRVPYYPLTHLLSAHPALLTYLRARLAYLASPSTTPTSPKGTQTYALLSSPSSHLGPTRETTLDIYPLFRALFRLRAFDHDGGGWDADARAALRRRTRKEGDQDRKEEKQAKARGELGWGEEGEVGEGEGAKGVGEGKFDPETLGDRDHKPRAVGVKAGQGGGQMGPTPWPDVKRLGGGRDDGRSGGSGGGGGGDRRVAADRRDGGSSRGMESGGPRGGAQSQSQSQSQSRGQSQGQTRWGGEEAERRGRDEKMVPPHFNGRDVHSRGPRSDGGARGGANRGGGVGSGGGRGGGFGLS